MQGQPLVPLPPCPCPGSSLSRLVGDTQCSNAVGLFCWERASRSVWGVGQGVREGWGVKASQRKGEEKWERKEEKGMACGYEWPTGTYVSRWGGRRCALESFEQGRGGHLLSVRLVLLKTFFSKAICSFKEGNVSS